MADETLEQANQRKFSSMFDILSVLEEIVYKAVMRALNWKVLDGGGKMQSIFDLVRSGGGIYTEVPWYGGDGKVQAGARKTTTLAIDAGWSDARAGGLARENAALREAIRQLSLGQGVTIDYKEIARVVADEADNRDRDRLEITPAPAALATEEVTG
ncbi:hypothetical protein [Arthrobacter sp. SX1312]|uniref:hypothetical protein n=1 Tax=Arthrobacter sp. SX1312 TaxID=2058896 RepID=UPI000CE3DF82|nr:hypothetical protein [Arthrobacter sp. SX1312]